MRLDQQQQIRQTQRLGLVMTPQLRQAVAILQYSGMELAEFLQEESLQNPLLELDPQVLDRDEDADGQDRPEAAEEADVAAGAVDPSDLEQWLAYFSDSSDLALSEPLQPADSPDWVELAPAAGPGLAEHLRLQLASRPSDGDFLTAAGVIIDSLDPDGYLRVPLPELAATSNCGVLCLRSALRAVQQLDPAGVAARDLRECLLLQLQRMDPPPALAVQLVTRHLERLARPNLRQLAACLSCDEAAAAGAIDLVRGLDPRPGSAFSPGQETRYIVPDVVVEHVGDQFVVMLNDGATPRLGISPYYRRLAGQGSSLAAETAAFLAERLRAATWVLRCVEQRRATIYRVAQALVERQPAFFAHGPRYLRPMTLKDIARAIGVHESTVSRAVANKYVQTPQGAYPLRYFFASAIAGAGSGEAVASTSVREVIRELIAAEDPRRPHSDERLAELLRRRGAEVARRTVTKYRRELGLPSSAERRRPSGR